MRCKIIQTILIKSPLRNSSRAFKGRRASNCHIVLLEYIPDVSRPRQLFHRGEEIIPVCAKTLAKSYSFFLSLSETFSSAHFSRVSLIFLENLKQNKLLSLLADVGIFCFHRYCTDFFKAPHKRQRNVDTCRSLLVPPSTAHGCGLLREITPLRQKTLKELAPQRERERERRKRRRDECI